jgi:hypothetical protein
VKSPTGQGAASGFGQANSLVQTSLWLMIVLAKRQKFPWEQLFEGQAISRLEHTVEPRRISNLGNTSSRQPFGKKARARMGFLSGKIFLIRAKRKSLSAAFCSNTMPKGAYLATNWQQADIEPRFTSEDRRFPTPQPTTHHLLWPGQRRNAVFLLPFSRPNCDFLGSNCNETPGGVARRIPLGNHLIGLPHTEILSQMANIKKTRAASGPARKRR